MKSEKLKLPWRVGFDDYDAGTCMIYRGESNSVEILADGLSEQRAQRAANYLELRRYRALGRRQ